MDKGTIYNGLNSEIFPLVGDWRKNICNFSKGDVKTEEVTNY
jgi:hypothetical protein